MLGKHPGNDATVSVKAAYCNAAMQRRQVHFFLTLHFFVTFYRNLRHFCMNLNF